MTLLIAMFIYAFTMAFTPGPNNLIVLSTGVNFGFRRALPFTFGVAIGFTLLLSAIGFGIGTFATRSEIFLLLLKYGGVFFLVYMAYKIATAPTTIDSSSEKEVGFVHGLLFQWINPKAWTACLGGIGAFNLAGNTKGLLSYIIISFGVVLFNVALWGYMGSKIKHFLSNEQNHKVFNYGMGFSLFLVAVYVLMME